MLMALNRWPVECFVVLLISRDKNHKDNEWAISLMRKAVKQIKQTKGD